VRVVWCAESNGTTDILIKIGVGQGFSTRGPLAGFQRLSQMKENESSEAQSVKYRLLTYLLRGATVLVELWSHILCEVS
jgi:hypothetical protein